MKRETTYEVGEESDLNRIREFEKSHFLSEYKMKIWIMSIIFSLVIFAMFFLGWKFMELSETRLDPTQYLVELAKCNPGSFVTVRFPGGGEFVCAPVHLPFPTKKPN